MERIWLKQYPAGVPADIDTSQYPSLVTLLEECFAKFRDRKAFICMDKSISYRELDARAFAQALALQIGTERQRQLVELAIADRLVHADERFAIAEFGEAFFQQGDQ